HRRAGAPARRPERVALPAAPGTRGHRGRRRSARRRGGARRGAARAPARVADRRARALHRVGDVGPQLAAVRLLPDVAAHRPHEDRRAGRVVVGRSVGIRRPRSRRSCGVTARYTLLHGVDTPPQELRPLRAAELECVVDGVDLRYVTAGGVEVVRRIYAAVRDRNWNTIPGTIESYELDDRGDSFEARFTVRHRSHDVDFVWDGSIAGGDDGRIAVSLDGRAERAMLYNRIGFCVLHPFRETRGRPY